MSTEENNDNVPSASFDDFGLSPEVMKGVAEAGFRAPSPIQEKAIPIVLSGADMVGQAHTGTGKTAAFGLPVLSRVKNTGNVEVLVITPTRELAGQVSDELYRLGRYAGVRTTTVYGGQSYDRQMRNINSGVQVVVATPGRLNDMLESGRINSRNFAPTMVVLDEADEMLDMGFLDDIKKIFTHLPEERQTLLFSATMPPPIKRLAEKILKEPVFASVISTKDTTNKDIEQQYYVIEERERDNAVIRLIDSQEPSKSIIFCRTKKEVDRIDTLLVALGYSARGLHGDMEQRQREEVIRNFRNGTIEILVATDVAARGLDVTDVSHVFNYHIPFDPESYVHRIGRTARAGRKGVAVTLVTPLEFKELGNIQRTVGSRIRQSWIPSGQDVRRAHIQSLLHDIQQQPISDEAAGIMEALKEEMDNTQITYKLVSYLLSQQTVAGPEKIGVSQERLKKIINMNRARQKERRGFSRRRSGGGGGYGKGGYGKSYGKGRPTRGGWKKGPGKQGRGFAQEGDSGGGSGYGAKSGGSGYGAKSGGSGYGAKSGGSGYGGKPGGGNRRGRS